MLLFLYSLLILQPTSSQAAAAAAQCEISLDSTLSSTSSWLSPSGRFSFGFYREEGGHGGGGFNVGILFMESPNKRTVIWTANRNGTISVSSNTKIKLVEKGLKLLHANSQGEDLAISSTGSFDHHPAYCASMLDSGNLVIYDSNSNVIWQTFDYPTDTLIAGQVMSENQQLISSISQTNHSEGRFRILMQSDRNLVMYPIGMDYIVDNAYWASNTFQSIYSSVILGEDGILFLSDGNQSRQNLTTGDSSYNPNSTLHLARLEPNGMLYIYAYDLLENTSKVIDMIPDDQCDVKGICGFNSYCTFSAEKQVCLCLPGFDYLNTEDTHAGCQVKFISNACPGIANDDTYYNTMDDLENIQWLKEPWSPLERFTSKEDCRDSCLNDCSCQAAQYYENDCWKQSLPLKFGRKLDGDHDIHTVTFIKITKRRNISRGLDASQQIVINKEEFRGAPLIVFVTVVSGLIIFILVFVFVVFRCLVGRNRMIRRSKELALADEIAPRSFSYHELYEATEGYKEEVGKGAFGTVFRGTLPSTGRSVAVKRLERVVEDGEREFQTEMKVIGRTHHRNLVRLLGYCNEGSNRLLVYEFMTNGSLADLIFKADQNRPHWKERLRIALDVARGIHYLHEDCETHIIHCDIKPQNILMDEYWTAKISDFGLAKLLMPTQTRTFTGVRGTRGYLAPEWHKNVPITVKTDVYSFGIVLLEILCCRKNMELEVDADEIILSNWVCKCYLAGELEKLRLDEDVDMVEFEKAVKVGLWCIQTDPILRPSMKNVIIMLEGSTEISSPPSTQLLF